MAYSKETELRIFIDVLRVDMVEMYDIFFGADTDPEVSWQLFREELRKYKKKHVKLYEEYLGTDSPNENMEGWQEHKEWQKLKENRP